MSKISHFTDLHCWQSAKALSMLIYKLSTPLLNNDSSTKNQLRRASLSIMNNVAEGFARFSAKEQIRFYEIAQSSASEVESMLILLESLTYISKAEFDELIRMTHATRYQILALIKYLNARQP